MSQGHSKSSAKEEQAESASSRRARGRQKPVEPTARPEASVNMDELRELMALLRENGLAEFELEREGFRVRLRRESSVLPQPSEVGNNSTASRPVTAAQQSATVPAHPGARAET